MHFMICIKYHNRHFVDGPRPHMAVLALRLVELDQVGTQMW